jgi:signal transduction histidine kinase
MQKPAPQPAVAPLVTLDQLAASPTRDRLRQGLRRMKWLIPLGMVALVVAFELGPVVWIHNRLGQFYHLLSEIAFYGTVGPLLAYLSLVLLERWLDERETAELQARALNQAREHVAVSRQLNDDALQTLFAASLLLDSMKDRATNLPPEVAAQLKSAEGSLETAIQKLRHYLLSLR